jgi:hypothetical protein
MRAEKNIYISSFGSTKVLLNKKSNNKLYLKAQ